MKKYINLFFLLMTKEKDKPWFSGNLLFPNSALHFWVFMMGRTLKRHPHPPSF
jgi:hypothetical protein